MTQHRTPTIKLLNLRRRCVQESFIPKLFNFNFIHKLLAPYAGSYQKYWRPIQILPRQAPLTFSSGNVSVQFYSEFQQCSRRVRHFRCLHVLGGFVVSMHDQVVFHVMRTFSLTRRNPGIPGWVSKEGGCSTWMSYFFYLFFF